MTIPRFAGLPLLLDETRECAGAAFELTKTARESAVVQLGDWEVEVHKNAEIVVARGGAERSFEDAYSEALDHAQKGLDLMSIRGTNDLAIKLSDLDSDYLVWWPESLGLVIRICSISSMVFDFSIGEPILTGADGNIIPPPAKPVILWHESYRYFRISQTTDDLFDAYRNAYLALESVLSSIAPQRVNAAGRPKEGERDWFRRALIAADGMVPLRTVVPPGTPDPIDDLIRELFVEMRSAMSHAKSGRRILLPRDATERQAVNASFQRLVHLYLVLAEAHLGARRASGGLTAFAFRKMHFSLLDSMTAVVSDDESPFSGTDSSPNPAGGMVIQLRPMAPPREPESFAVTRLWYRIRSEVGLPHVRRIVGLKDEQAGIVGVLRGPLELGSSHRLELLLGVRGSNVRQSRFRYTF